MFGAPVDELREHLTRRDGTVGVLGHLAASFGAQRRVAVLDHVLLIGLGDTEQHSDDPHRHLSAEVLDEVEAPRPDEWVKAAGGELPDLGFQRGDLAGSEYPRQQLSVDVVDRWILEDQRARRNLHPGFDDFEHGAVRGAERLVVQQRRVDVLVAAQCEEVVLRVVVQRHFFSDASEHRVWVAVEFDVIRVVVDIAIDGICAGCHKPPPFATHPCADGLCSRSGNQSVSGEHRSGDLD